MKSIRSVVGAVIVVSAVGVGAFACDATSPGNGNPAAGEAPTPAGDPGVSPGPGASGGVGPSIVVVYPAPPTLTKSPLYSVSAGSPEQEVWTEQFVKNRTIH